MTFTLFTLLSILALSAVVSMIRFRATGARLEHGYPDWLKRGTLDFLKHPRKTLHAVAERYRGWIAIEYPGWMIWIPWTLFASIVYQAISGIGAALFFRNGMRGIFLLLHMAAGALFAVSLALDLLLHARDHGKYPLTAPLSSIVFWIFIGCGILITTTALGSMMESFTLRGQLTLIGIHRYAATVMVLAAAARFELAGRK